jgi:bifunctional non-homologous end joining protein LigD
MTVARATRPLQRRIPITFLPFDVLVLGGKDITTAPYLDRRSELAALGEALGGVGGLPIQVPPHWQHRSGQLMLDAAHQAGMEGIVSKRVSSIYLPGQRSRSWVKTLIRTRSSCLVIGFVGSSRSVATLVLGAYDDAGRLVEVGQVGSGFSVAMRRQLREELRPLERTTTPLADPSPPGGERDGVRWVDPVVVVDVDHREYRPGGLRHPSYKGRRPDLDPAAVPVADLG